MNERPEQLIKRYVMQQGGRAEATVEHLLVSFGIPDDDGPGREGIEDYLQAVGVALGQSLAGLNPGETVELSIAAAGAPPWHSAPTMVLPAQVPTPAMTAVSPTPASTPSPAPDTRSRRGLWIGIAVFVLLAIGGGAGGYVFGSSGGADLDAARVAGQAEGQRVAAANVDPRTIKRASRTGRRAGYRRAYRTSFRKAKTRTLAGAPQVCGDVRTNETPVLIKIRAEQVSCDQALAFVRSTNGCDLESTCQGYSCDAVSTGYESSEFTCTNGSRRIRFISAV
jgi:hypothetical protein